jgi:hypothetical protein
MKRFAGLFGVCAVLFAPAALAQGTDEFGAYGGMEGRGKTRSEQETAFEIRVGPYKPNIDDGLNGTPYADTFGDKTRWHFGLEGDWQVLRIPKTLSFGPGFGFHFTRMSAKAPLSSGSGLSAQDTTLTIIPMHLVGVLRVDAIADRSGVPFCPYAKLGLGYALWWSKDGEEAAKAPDGTEGKDTSYGLTFALGMAFRLDWLDPADAAAADAAIGINHSSIFGEYFVSDLSGFGSNDVMNVGTNTFVFGAMLEI